MNRALSEDRLLVTLLLVYTAASFAHFAHNAAYLHDYPNLPEWLTAAGVWWAWVGVASVGVAGCVMLWVGLRLTAMIVLAVYAFLGFGGLDHYVVAPVSAHTVVMNLTIAAEAFTALVLLGYLIHRMVRTRAATSGSQSV